MRLLFVVRSVNSGHRRKIGDLDLASISKRNKVIVSTVSGKAEKPSKKSLRHLISAMNRMKWSKRKQQRFLDRINQLYQKTLFISPNGHVVCYISKQQDIYTTVV